MKELFLHFMNALLISGIYSQQYFRVRPHDTSVVSGRTAELHCHIGNRAGLVQWSKDGFLLGYNPEIPGYARYEMQVDHSNSAYTLLVHEARLDDEGEYQCQVGPGKNEKPIRSVAKLTVLVPPKSLAINSLPNASDIEVREAEKLLLECQAVSSKPATILKWFRKNVELMPEASKTNVRREGEKLYTTVSSITLYPKGEVVGVSYSCEAIHPGLNGPWRTTATVQVLYPPNPPEIEGYREDDMVQSGERLTLTCISKGGKPPARLVWNRNGDILEGTYSTIGREAINVVDITVRPDDNNAIFGCTAVNPLTPRPLLKTIKLSVLFPPSSVHMEGSTEAHRGDTVTVKCRSDSSNPPSEISWLIDGVPVEADESNTAGDSIGWYTTSRVSAIISRQDIEKKVFTCFAVGVAQNKAISRTFNVTIIYPPEAPAIGGYFEGEQLRSGQVHEFSCTAIAGYPPAELKWFKGDTEVKAQVTLSSGRLVSRLAVETEPSDNGAIVACEVNNSAISKPLRAEFELVVLFPPSNVTVTVDPVRPKEGDKAKLECWSSSSNPASKIVWWQNGRLLPADDTRTIRSSDGGFATGGTLSLKTVTAADDGTKFTCEAKNEAFESSVESRFTLRIRYPPEFTTSSRTYDIREGQAGQYNVSARAYPEVNQYTWTRSTSTIPSLSSSTLLYKPRVSYDGPILFFDGVLRDDAGEYICIAENTEGKTSTSMILNVLFPASVVNVTGKKEVAQGEMTTLLCLAEGNPLTEKSIFWRRKDSQKVLSSNTATAGRSVLTIRNATRSQSGDLECVANNGVGPASVSTFNLAVMFRPNMLRENLKRQIAVGNRSFAEISCGAEGHPEVTFTWSYNGTTISTGPVETQKYLVNMFARKEYEWWSTLRLKDVDWSDMGVYTCVAANTLGHDFITFTLAKTGIPERPDLLEAKNISHDGAVLSWRPGFDGGMSQTFWLRYRDLQESNYSFVEITHNRSSFSVYSLRQGTVYEFALAARNPLGESAFTPVLRIKTKNLPVMDSTVSQMDSQGDSSNVLPTWLLVAAVIGGLVVVANLLLCVGYIRRRKCFPNSAGGPGPDLASGDDDLSGEKKIPKKKKIVCGLEEESPPFYLSGTTVDLPDEALDLSNFQKSPTLRPMSHESSDDGHSSASRRCDCGGRQWGSTLICVGGSPSHGSSGEQHQQCPDLLKRDSCHCHTNKLASGRCNVSEVKSSGSNIHAQDVSFADPFLAGPAPSQIVLTTFQSKTELPIRHSLLDVSRPKLETMINGDGEES